MNDYSTCPYRTIGDDRRWDRAVAATPAGELDPGLIGNPPSITPTTRVGTAGSCFAQRISETLRRYGYSFFEAEAAPRWLPEDKRGAYGYGVFSARYGNIYTTLQLVQLLERCMGKFTPLEPEWTSGERYLDPFRPRISPAGYASLAELKADRENHLRAVLRLFSEVEVFVFTLGLTEAWICKEDGAVLPVCPGCGVGRFDPEKYFFHNFGVDEVVSQLKRFMELLGQINARASVVFTVSPVPLAATMESHNVLLSSTYSKAVLRIAAQTIVKEWKNACYFPSYEIITSSMNNLEYFAQDGRNVTEAGVGHVMRCFFRHFANANYDNMIARSGPTEKSSSSAIVCDEEELAQALAAQQIRASLK